MARLERARDFLFIVCLGAFPLFLLTIRGWTNAFFFLLVLISATYWRELRASYREKNFDRSTLAVIIALASGTAAVLVSQALRGEFSVRELDGPSRMAGDPFSGCAVAHRVPGLNFTVWPRRGCCRIADRCNSGVLLDRLLA